MRPLMRYFILFMLAFSGVATLACSGQQPQQSNANLEKKSVSTSSLTADPNPIKVCDGSGLGKTTLRWSGTTDVELHSADGTLLAKGLSGAFTTGNWVYDGATFYLQDASGGKIGTVKIALTKEGCP